MYDGTDIVQLGVAINSAAVVGDSAQAGIIVSLSNLTQFQGSLSGATFASTNPAVITISPDGVWTALSPGTANIVVTYFGKSGTQQVTVAAVQDSLGFRASSTSGNIRRGGVVTISTVMLYTLV